MIVKRFEFQCTAQTSLKPQNNHVCDTGGHFGLSVKKYG